MVGCEMHWTQKFPLIQHYPNPGGRNRKHKVTKQPFAPGDAVEVKVGKKYVDGVVQEMNSQTVKVLLEDGRALTVGRATIRLREELAEAARETGRPSAAERVHPFSVPGTASQLTCTNDTRHNAISYKQQQ
ncbi:unnamed protein product [Prorocentrum cordatum]|uniref:RNA chaperone ProQ C-terminal domain-containing protein n=1 Tax=Prorocentrum cordatum TaxID=2364126 RepID=A0ABN9W8E5_9DINO|nr:unnamed protein product [Polarella glacialis]